MGTSMTTQHGSSASRAEGRERRRTMKAAVFVGEGRIVLEEKPVPKVGPRDALLRVTTTTICGTDVHILRGEYPVARGLTVGHEPVASPTRPRTSHAYRTGSATKTC